MYPVLNRICRKLRTEIGQDFKGDLITKRRKIFFSRGPLKVLVLHLNKSVKTNIAPIQSVSSRLCKETTKVTNSRKRAQFLRYRKQQTDTYLNIVLFDQGLMHFLCLRRVNRGS